MTTEIKIEIINHPLLGALTKKYLYTYDIHGNVINKELYVDTSLKNDIEFGDASKGIIFVSPNGSKYRQTIDNDGVITTTLIP